MANKSSTKRKSDTDRIAEYGYNVVSQWAKARLAELESGKELICIKLSEHKYRVAAYTLEHVGNIWQVTKDTTMWEFDSKVSAVAFCAVSHAGYTKNAQEILTLDTKVQRLLIDKHFFSQRLSSALKKNDVWNIGLYHSRYEESKAILHKAQSELKKTVTWAKYLQLWSV